MASLNHIHLYERWKKIKDTGTVIYRCTHPLCTHTAEKSFILGKACKCVCGNEFVLTMEDLRRFRPRCFDCSNTKASREQKGIESLLKAAGLDVSTNIQIPDEDNLRSK